MPRYTVRGHVPLAKALFKYGLHDKFDLAAAHELRLDHSLVVPLHFLNPSMELPVVPIYTNGFASPLPLATSLFFAWAGWCAVLSRHGKVRSEWR